MSEEEFRTKLDEYEKDIELNVDKHTSIINEEDEIDMLINAARKHKNNQTF